MKAWNAFLVFVAVICAQEMHSGPQDEGKSTNLFLNYNAKGALIFKSVRFRRRRTLKSYQYSRIDKGKKKPFTSRDVKGMYYFASNLEACRLDQV